MIHLSDELGLTLEALLGIGRKLARGNELHRDVAAPLGIARAIDDSHAAAAELGHDLVSIGQFGTNHC
jgi:hypothetical protein